MHPWYFARNYGYYEFLRALGINSMQRAFHFKFLIRRTVACKSIQTPLLILHFMLLPYVKLLNNQDFS